MTWVDQLTQRARLIHDQILGMREQASLYGLSPDEASSSFYDLLEQIYLDDFPLARAKDSSDLLLHIEGEAVDHLPRLSLVSGLFDSVKFQVRDLTKAISGILPERRVTVKEIDLALSGLARGSLFIGFKAPLPGELGDEANLLAAEDPLYKATKDALHIINIVSHRIGLSPEETQESVSEIVDDPKIRDAAFLAVKRISPSGRKGIDKIGVTGGDDYVGAGDLTPATRMQINKILAKPAVSNELVQFEGTVREIDLDAKRFEIRGISDEKVQDIRCVYGQIDIQNPRQLLDAKVRVLGYVARRADEAPRLLSLQRIEMLNLPILPLVEQEFPGLLGSPYVPKLPRF